MSRYVPLYRYGKRSVERWRSVFVVRLSIPTSADALDAAVNGCPERAPRGLRNRAGVPQIP